jgi:Sir2 family
MASTAPQSPRWQAQPSPERVSISPVFLRIPELVKARSRSLTPTRPKMPPPARRSLPQYTIDDVARLLVESQKIVVLAGAGISTCVGIPDFRSKQGNCDRAVLSVHDS